MRKNAKSLLFSRDVAKDLSTILEDFHLVHVYMYIVWKRLTEQNVVLLWSSEESKSYRSTV